ncbi:MAG: DM13 domain-containing protein, partial [Pseudomonadota bacterium]
ADGNYLVISDDFKTLNAPDLKFFLSKNNFQAINGSNATQDAVLISPLSKNKGSQEYKIPSNIDVSDYSSLIIHCQQFSKLWASTPIH